jgi:hypothetical protein
MKTAHALAAIDDALREYRADARQSRQVLRSRAGERQWLRWRGFAAM